MPNNKLDVELDADKLDYINNLPNIKHNVDGTNNNINI